MSGGQFKQMFAQWAGEGSEPEPAPLPAWFGPPESELGECVPLSLVVARSERAIVALRSATAYSSGAVFDFVALARGLSEREANRLFHDQHPAGGEDEPPHALLRIGFELGDGARVSNLGRGHRPVETTAEPSEPVLNPCGGGGGWAGGGRVNMQHSYWLWPLPPPGTVRIYVEWPALGVPLSSIDFDAGSVREAAQRSLRLWGDE